jgi:MFS family permease
MALGRATRGRPRAALLGVAAGISFGVSALLTKALVHYLGQGIFAWVPHWEPYGLAVSAIGGVIVAQSALQTGALGTAVGSIESMSVISGSLFGLFLLDERVGAHTPFEIFAVVVSIAAILGGIVKLANSEERILGAPSESSA